MIVVTSFAAGFGVATMLVGAIAVCCSIRQSNEVKRIGGVYSKVGMGDTEMVGVGIDDSIDDILGEDDDDISPQPSESSSKSVEQDYAESLAKARQ